MRVKIGRPNLEHAVMAACVVALVAGVSGAVSDNSLLVHLRTGIDIVDTWSIPDSDPYSFTALGQPWVVQSWLASAIYGLAHALAGEHLVTVVHMLLAGAAGVAMAVVGRSGTMLRTLSVLFVPTVLGVYTWTQRPLLFGVVGFALVVLVVHKRMSPWWLLPVMWVWVNTHGSYPIALAWVASVFVGQWIDSRSVDRSVAKYFGFAVAGVLLGAVNPVGPKVLGFAFGLAGERSGNFGAIAEWQSPDFHSLGGLVGLAALVVIVAAGFARRVDWRYALGVVGLIAATLFAARHMTMLAVAAVPFLAAVVGRGVAAKAPARERAREARIAFATLVVVAVLGVGVTAGVFQRDGVDYSGYPVAAVDWLQANGYTNGDKRVASTDLAGCYMIWRYGGDVGVFIDDRVDMYPADVYGDFRHLIQLDEAPAPILDRYRVDAVLWSNKRPLANALPLDANWQQTYRDDDWTVFARR